MIKKDILKQLKEIKESTFELSIKVHVITKEEFIKITGRIDRQAEKLIKEMEQE